MNIFIVRFSWSRNFGPHNSSYEIAFMSWQLPGCSPFHERRLARCSEERSSWIWLVRGTDSPDVHMVDWTQLFRAVSATCFFTMASRYLYGIEHRFCRDGDVFQCLDLLVFPKKYSVHLLAVLCIKREGLKLPNSESHKPAWNSLLFVMKSFCWVVFMETLRMAVNGGRVPVPRCFDSCIFQKERYWWCLSFFFFHRQIGT